MLVTVGTLPRQALVQDLKLLYFALVASFAPSGRLGLQFEGRLGLHGSAACPMQKQKESTESFLTRFGCRPRTFQKETSHPN